MLQRSKATWLQLGDSNTAYFYKYMRKKNYKRMITSVADDAGNLITDLGEIHRTFIQYFTASLGSAAQTRGGVQPEIIAMGPVLTLEQQVSLIKPFTTEDVRIAMFNIDSTKNPGSDGFSSGFFKDTWSDLGTTISAAVIKFFHECSLPTQLCHTLITLLPKVENACHPRDYRPIACCQTLYKVISKMLCFRLAKILPTLIGNQQGAFVQGRSIIHNVLIGQDLLRGYKRTRLSPRCLMKIDLQKAYDTVDWGFLFQLLEAFHFPDQFIGWLRLCVCNVRYSLVLNGEQIGYIKARKGLRQGDPLSPLLFILVMEYLTRTLDHATLHPQFRFHPSCK